jgi:sialate O-acetylesterase
MKNKFIGLLFLFCIAKSKASITLPKIFTSNMVLQRDKDIKIWGRAGKGEKVSVSFNGQTVKSTTDGQGNWIVSLKAMKYGGPYEMTIAGKKEAIHLKNILIGDVWICSGQSNMEWTINNANNAKKEIAESNYPQIRLFTVQKAMSFRPEIDVESDGWQECNPQSIGDFSAVAYFFGRKLNKDLNIPIGLINTSWGGTYVQAWISWDSMSKKPEFRNVNFKDLEKLMAERKIKQQQYQQALQNDRGMTEKWYDPSANVTGWKKIQLPKVWEATEIGNADGVVWFKKEFDLTENLAGNSPAGQSGKIVLSLGPIDDIDETWVNGKLVGTTNVWNRDRIYTIDAAVLKKGKNVIIIKVNDTGGGGGLYGKQEQLYIEAEGNKISLAGEWFYKTSVVTTDYGIIDAGPNSFPSQLYNAMIAPLIQYAIKGGIWYQGEANAWEAYNYRSLFPEMINDWRSRWGYEFPFFWVQLANYMNPVSTPSPSDWAELREAQNMALSLPQTGQAITIDIGETEDIHPRNKQDVGYRLALAAEKIAYKKEVVYSGPVFQSMKKEGDKIILTFTNIGSGLVAKDKYGYLKSFAIAGSDQKFLWAKALIEGNKVIVFNEDIPDPVAVRYAWADNPDDANLYNKEGLPASPFRTDNWKGKTEK